MAKNQLTGIQLAKLLEPWFPLFIRVATAAERDVLSAISILGLPRKTERATDFHRAFRNNFRRVCDLAPQFFTLKEEPDGQGLDCLLCRMKPKNPFAVRWGRYNGETIRRNRTGRSADFQEQGLLFPIDEPESANLPTLTLAHTIEDEITIVGQSQMWIGRLYLLQERSIQSEVITEVHAFEQPVRRHELDEMPSAIVEARKDETEKWKKIVEGIRRSA